MAQRGSTTRKRDLHKHEGLLPNYFESRWATIDMNLKIKQEKRRKKETLKPRQYSRTLFSTAQSFNFELSSLLLYFQQNNPALYFGGFTDLKQQTPTTQATMWKIFRLSNNRLKGLCPWAAVQPDPDNIYVFLLLIFDKIKANKKKKGILAEPPLLVFQAWC